MINIFNLLFYNQRGLESQLLLNDIAPVVPLILENAIL